MTAHSVYIMIHEEIYSPSIRNSWHSTYVDCISESPQAIINLHSSTNHIAQVEEDYHMQYVF